MYLIRHEKSGELLLRSYAFSDNAYSAAIQRVMDSGETHSVLWVTEGQESCLGAIDAEVMLTISGGNATPTTIRERHYIAALRDPMDV
jgi:hypothetical protein